MSEKIFGTILAVVVFAIALYAMRKAGDALRDQIKGGKK